MSLSKKNIRLSALLFALIVAAISLLAVTSARKRASESVPADAGDGARKIAIITAGQSNTDGRNPRDEFPPQFPYVTPAVHIFKDASGSYEDFSIPSNPTRKDWAFDAVVYNLLTSPEYGGQDEIYVMKKSKGGTSIDPEGGDWPEHWTVDFDKLPDISLSLLNDFAEIIKAAMASKGDDFEIKAFLWHQGEGDSRTVEVASRYYDNLKRVLAYVRDVVGNPELLFVCGTISKNNVSDKCAWIVNDAFARLASEDPHFRVVDLSEAELFDPYHFNSAWSTYFGEKVYDILVDEGVVNGKKVNPVKP